MTLTKRTSAVFRTDPGKRTTASGYREIDIEGAEVAIAIAFFKGIIRKLLTAQFRHYTGSPDSWTNSVVAQRGAGVMEVKPYIPTETVGLLEPEVNKVRQSIAREWLLSVLDKSPWVKEWFVPYAETKLPQRPLLLEDSSNDRQEDDWIGPEILSDLDVDDIPGESEVIVGELINPSDTESILPPSDLSDTSRARHIVKNVRAIMDDLVPVSTTGRDTKRQKKGDSLAAGTASRVSRRRTPSRMAAPRPGALLDVQSFYSDPSDSDRRRKRRNALGDSE